MHTEEWGQLTEKLRGFVQDYSQKVIAGTRGFQI